MAKRVHDDQTLPLWDEQAIPDLFAIKDTPPSKKPKSAPRRKINLFQWAVYLTYGAFGLLLLIVLAVGAGELDRELSRHPRFALELPLYPGGDSGNIEIQGLRHASRRDLMLLFEPDFGRSVYHVPLAERRQQMLRLEWIREASLQRIWPNRLRIRVVESEPVAFVHFESRPSQLIDASGKLMSVPLNSRFRLPVMIGLRAQDTAEVRASQVRRMLKFLKEVGPLSATISEIDASNPRDIRVVRAVGNLAITFSLGETNFKTRLEYFDRNYAQVAENEPSSTAFILSIDGKITSTSPEAILGR